jgi:hypothetical protein
MQGRVNNIVVHNKGGFISANEVIGINCGIWEYKLADLCNHCDRSCTNGCTKSGACISECHPSCATCSHDDNNPGKGDECTSCFCGAELVYGHCVCKEDYIGEANDCKLKCHDGCQSCLGTGEHECLVCELGYELNAGSPGTCEWCDESICDEDGHPLCNDRGFAQTPCQCNAGQWWDGAFCMDCGDGCTSCTKDGECEACEEGLYRFGSRHACFDFCPFGYGASGDLCTPKRDSYDVFWMKFAPTEDASQIWEYRGFDNSWLVRAYGGVSEEAGELEEPYIFEDRGAWFDGKYDVITF